MDYKHGEGGVHLLEGVLAGGWTQRRRQQFLRTFRHVLVRSILYHVRIRFGAEGLRVVRHYLEGLTGGLEKENAEATLGASVPPDPLDAAVDTLNDVLQEVFRENDNLVQKHHSYDGDIPFEAFLRKCVEFKFWDRQRCRHGPGDLLQAIADRKRAKVRAQYVRAAHDTLGEQVRLGLRQRFPHIEDVRHEARVIAYFFEVFAPRALPVVRERLTEDATGGALLALLLDYFTEEDYRTGTEHTPQILARSTTSTVMEEKQPVLFSVEEEAAYYWDRLIHCDELDARDMASRLLLHLMKQLGEVELDKILCCAMAEQKAELRRRGHGGSAQAQRQLENVRMWLVWRCSQSGRCRDGPSPEELSPDRLTLEQVAGRYFRWEEDICRKLFGRNVRQDRIEEQIGRFLRTTQWINLAGQGGACNEH